MKIIQITTQWKGTVGGPSNYVYNLLECLENMGHEVFVFSRADNIFSNEKRVVYIRSNYFISIIQQLRRFILLKPDIIHVHGSIKLVVVPLLYKIIFNNNVKIVFTFHTQPTIYDYFNNIKVSNSPYMGFDGRVGTYLLGFCDNVTSVSKSIIDNLNTHTRLQINKFNVIYSGFNPQSFISPRVTLKSTKFKSDGPIIITTGVFSWDWKVAGHLLLIKSIYELKKEFPLIKLYILGDGIYRSKIEEYIQLYNLNQNVILKGNVLNVNQYLLEADVYAHFGLNEGSPLALVEAMGAGCSIIAANSGGIPEVLDENCGILVQPNVLSIVFKIRMLLLDFDLRKRLGENCKTYAFENYTWDTITKKYIELYFN